MAPKRGMRDVVDRTRLGGVETACVLNGALALGNHRLGAVRAGYLADLDILTANPLDDIKIMYGTGATRQAADGTARQVKALKFTIRDGVVYDSQALMKDVQEIVAKAKAAQKGEGQ